MDAVCANAAPARLNLAGRAKREETMPPITAKPPRHDAENQSTIGRRTAA